jgi:hypothetical protein
MALEESRYIEVYNNTKEAVLGDLEELLYSEDREDVEVIESCSIYLMAGYYDLSLLSFVVDYDVNSFCENLCRAARSDLFLLKKHKVLDGINWSYVNAADIRSIHYALATDDIDLAKEISTVRTKTFVSPHDASDLYFYSIILRQILEGDTEESEEKINDFDEVRKGTREGASVVLRALLEKDNKKFDQGIHLLISEWGQIVKEDDFQDFPGGVRPGEHAICIQALALIRLAEHIGMTVRSNYPMVPEEILKFKDYTPPTDGFPVMDD